MKRKSFTTHVALISIVALFVVLCSWTPALAKPWQLYATGTNSENTSTLYRINVHTGAAKAIDDFTSIDPIVTARGLAFDTDNDTLYAIARTLPTPTESFEAIFTVDPKSAVSSLIGVVPDSSQQLLGGLTYDSNHGVLYATGLLTVGFQVRSSVFTVDPVTGAVGVASVHVPFNLFAGGLAYDPAHDIMYATGTVNSPEQSALFVIDVKNHSTTFIGFQTPDAFLGFGGLALDPSTGVLYATGFDLTKPGDDPSRTALYVVDPETGHATKIGPTGGNNIGLGKLTFVPAGKSDNSARTTR
jgi:hypothetical protein